MDVSWVNPLQIAIFNSKLLVITISGILHDLGAFMLDGPLKPIVQSRCCAMVAILESLRASSSALHGDVGKETAATSVTSW